MTALVHVCKAFAPAAYAADTCHRCGQPETFHKPPGEPRRLTHEELFPNGEEISDTGLMRALDKLAGENP
jgi:hypothetical protein